MVVKGSWHLCKKHWKVLLGIVSWYIIPLVIVHSLGQIVYFGIYGLPLTVVFYVFFGLLALLVQVALILAFEKLQIGKINKLPRHLSQSLKFLPAALVISIVVLLASVLGLLVVWFPFYVLSWFFTVPYLEVITFILILGLLLVASVYFLFPLYFLIGKSAGLVDSITGSLKMAQRVWWPLLNRVLSLVIVGAIASLLVLYALLLVIGLLVGSPGEGFQEGSDVIWWVQLSQMVVSMLFAPFFLGGIWLLYKDLSRKSK